MKLLSLLLLSSCLSLASAACNADNCLRALRATPTKASSFCATYPKTPNTATPIPTYGSFCSNSPSRVSSACSCVVTSTPTPSCVPSPVINAATRNGNFEDYPPPGQGVFNIQPPWYFNSRDSENAYGDYKTEPSSTGFGGALGTVAAFHLTGQSPNVLPGAFLRLQQPISYCNGTTYAFSLYARQLPPSNQRCRLSFFTDFEGTIATFETPVFTDQFQKFGPVTRKPFRDNGVINAKGEYEDLLSVLVQCTGITGQPVADTLFEVDAVRVEPVA
ncbi:MAG: hypothetical protein Q9166_007905 [cf. Caloplaca sp. 2 TL-2023]